jgi:hypothetical protein
VNNYDDLRRNYLFCHTHTNEPRRIIYATDETNNCDDYLNRDGT